jgi:hypothetical protein
MNAPATSWVVYLTPLKNTSRMKAICEQTEWEAMERIRPGFNTLIQAGFSTEGQAEAMARADTETKARETRIPAWAKPKETAEGHE